MDQQNQQQPQQLVTQQELISQQPSLQQPITDPGKTIGIVGFVMAFVGLSPVGLILSIISHSKSKKAGFNNKLSFAGIIINAVFILISALAIALLIVLSMASYSGINTIENSAIANTNASATQAMAKISWEYSGNFPDELSDFNFESIDSGVIGISLTSNINLIGDPNDINKANGIDTIAYQYVGDFGNATGGRVMYWDFTTNNLSATPLYIGTADESSDFNNI